MCFNMHINPEISQDKPPILRETREPCYKNIEPLENTNKAHSTD
jgi:hypothetical protein